VVWREVPWNRSDLRYRAEWWISSIWIAMVWGVEWTPPSGQKV